ERAPARPSPVEDPRLISHTMILHLSWPCLTLCSPPKTPISPVIPANAIARLLLDPPVSQRTMTSWDNELIAVLPAWEWQCEEEEGHGTCVSGQDCHSRRPDRGVFPGARAVRTRQGAATKAVGAMGARICTSPRAAVCPKNGAQTYGHPRALHRFCVLGYRC